MYIHKSDKDTTAVLNFQLKQNRMHFAALLPLLGLGYLIVGFLSFSYNRYIYAELAAICPFTRVACHSRYSRRLLSLSSIIPKERD